MLEELDKELKQQEISVIETLKRKIKLLEKEKSFNENEYSKLVQSLEKETIIKNELSDMLSKSKEKTEKLENLFSKLFNENQELVTVLRSCRDESNKLKMQFDTHLDLERKKAQKLENDIKNLKEVLEYMKQGRISEINDKNEELINCKKMYEEKIKNFTLELNRMKENVKEKDLEIQNIIKNFKDKETVNEKEWKYQIEQKGNLLNDIIKDLRKENREKAEKFNELIQSFNKEKKKSLYFETELKALHEKLRKDNYDTMNKKLINKCEFESKILVKDEEIKKIQNNISLLKV